MTRKYAIPAAAVALFISLAACNSSTYETAEQTASAAAVRSFSFAEDDSVMADLDSVFFSIDLIKGEIFNADSLPMGTKVTCLRPQITALETGSHIQLTGARYGVSDTTITYTASEADTLDFTNPVLLKVTSPDGLTSRTYTVKVNIHTVPGDSLYWGDNVRYPMPGLLSSPGAQRSTRAGDRIYTITGNTGSAACCIAYYDGVDDMGYSYLTDMPLHRANVTLPFVPDFASLTGRSDGQLYMLDTDGHLWTSGDAGESWTQGSQVWHSIIGCYDNLEVLGVARASDGTYTIERTGSPAIAMPQGFPVDGFSQPLIYSFPMSSRPQMMIVGGRRADGTYSPDTWGYDGNSWIRISKAALPAGLADATVIPYYSYYTVSGVTVRKQGATLVTGGRDAAGKLNTVTYISTDFGYNWRKAEDVLQLPAAIPAMYGATAFVLDTELRASLVPASVRARVSRPIESWACPYIYLYGGYTAAGTPVPYIWRGMIYRLTFKPLV